MMTRHEDQTVVDLSSAVVFERVDVVEHEKGGALAHIHGAAIPVRRGLGRVWMAGSLREALLRRIQR